MHIEPRIYGCGVLFRLEFHTLDMNIVRCRKVNKLLPEIATKFAEGGIRHHDVSRFSDLPNETACFPGRSVPFPIHVLRGAEYKC